MASVAVALILAWSDVLRPIGASPACPMIFIGPLATSVDFEPLIRCLPAERCEPYQIRRLFHSTILIIQREGWLKFVRAGLLGGLGPTAGGDAGTEDGRRKKKGRRQANTLD